jgi:hypothetical protein
MLAVHMDSGLGNQMLDYAEYLVIKKNNPHQDCFLENLIYELPFKNGMFSMWNGYELERIFGIKVPNIKEHFGDDAWGKILKYVEESEFWKEDWNFAPYITQALAAQGLKLTNLCGDKRLGLDKKTNFSAHARFRLTRFFQTFAGYTVKRKLRNLLAKQIIRKEKKAVGDIFRSYPDSALVGHSLAFRYRGFGIEGIIDELLEIFRFPEIADAKNREALQKIRAVNSVAIHARRSDLLSVNGYCYRFGFFKRAVKYIKKCVDNPVFFFFCDENSVGWCEENEKVFGLDFEKDAVYFIDWNKGDESFRDMQLMAECKHNIYTESSFGIWGGLLNRNPDKITCAPDPLIVATNYF